MSRLDEIEVSRSGEYGSTSDSPSPLLVFSAPPVPPTPAEREEKAKRMIAILTKVPAQIDELLHQSGGGSDEDKIASVSRRALY